MALKNVKDMTHTSRLTQTMISDIVGTEGDQPRRSATKPKPSEAVLNAAGTAKGITPHGEREVTPDMTW